MKRQLKKQRPIKLRVISDGTPSGTELYDADTGEQIVIAITAITWNVRVNKPATMTIEICGSEINAAASLVTMKTP